MSGLSKIHGSLLIHYDPLQTTRVQWYAIRKGVSIERFPQVCHRDGGHNVSRSFWLPSFEPDRVHPPNDLVTGRVFGLFSINSG